MLKNKLLFIFVALILICGFSVLGFALAGDEDCFIEVDLELSSPSILGNSTVVNATVWTSPDGVNWSDTYSTEFADYCELVYFKDGARLNGAPGTIGSYTAKYKVKDNVTVPERFRMGNSLITSGMVLASFDYDIVYQDFQVKFYPEGDTTFTDGIDFYSKIISDTKPYLGGNPLTLNTDYQISVYKQGESDPISEINGPGEYTIKVKIINAIAHANIVAGQEFSSTFFLTNQLSGFAYIDDILYEGMYNSEFAPLENRDSVEQSAVNYYTPTLKGMVGEVGSSLYSITYIDGNRPLSNPPREVGNYCARLTFNADIDRYDISAGDFVDVPYQIKRKPYTVSYTYNSNTPDQNGAFIVQSNGTNLAVSFKNLNSEDLTYLSEKTSVRYLYYNGTQGRYEEMTYGAVPTEKGLYRAVISISADTPIKGKNYFGNADDAYEISSSLYDNVWYYDFQIISTVKVQNISSQYTYTGNTISIVPEIKYSGASLDATNNYTITYFKEEGDSNTLIQAEDIIENGKYNGIISFIADWAPFGDVIVNSGDMYNFSFEIVLPQATPLLEEKNGALSFTINGRTPSGYNATYFRYENNICNGVDQSTLLSRVGVYKVVYTFTADNKSLGILAGDVITMQFEKKASGSLNDVYFGVKEAYALDGSFYTDYNSNIFFATLRFDEDQAVDAQIKNGLNYSVYYERIYNNGSVSICGYPILPGKYRAVLVFNEANAGYGVKAGDGLVFAFEIKPIHVTASFVVSDDLVYSREEKSFNISFKANGRPLNVSSDAYTLMSSTFQADTAEYSAFTSVMPKNAGSYRLAVVFVVNGYEKFGLEQFSLTSGAEYDVEDIKHSSVFSERIIIDKLQLTVVVGVPVEEKAMYHLDGSAVNATYAFYKSNGVSISNYADFENALSDSKVSALSSSVVLMDNDFTIKYLCSPLNSIASQEEVVDNSIKTARYKLEVKMKDGSSDPLSDNALISSVVYYYDGAKEGVDYDNGIYFSSNGVDGASFNVGYRISPLPLLISLPSSLNKELYYGEANAVTVNEIVFKTYDLNKPLVSELNGERYDKLDLASYNFHNYFDLKYYNRKTGTDVINGEPLKEGDSSTLSNAYLFSAGDYMLSLTVKDIDTLPDLFSYFTIDGGLDEQYVQVNGKPMAVGDIKNIRLTVNSAKVIRAVFERNFNTFAVDGNKKEFTIAFYYGDSKLSDTSFFAWEYVNRQTNLGLGKEAPSAVGSYAIRVTFSNNNFQYAIRQLEGEYILPENSKPLPYIVGGSKIEFDFEITEPINLAWGWYIDGQKLDYDSYSVSSSDYSSYKFDYNHAQKGLQVRFFDFNATERPVNLIKNTDYTIWFYKVTSNDGKKVYTRLDEEPIAVGEYIAEIVFLRTHYDYFVKYNGNYNKIPYSYTEAENEDGRYGKSLAFSPELFQNTALEGRYFEFTIRPSNLMIGGFTVESKEYDGSTSAQFTLKPSYTILDNGALIEDDLLAVKELLDLDIRANFNKADVEFSTVNGFTVLPQDVTFSIFVQEGVLINLPSITSLDIAEKANKSVLDQLDALISSANGELLTKLNSIKRLFERIGNAYNIVIGSDGASKQGVQGKIIRRVVTVSPTPFERYYDPFYKDTESFKFTTDMPENLKDLEGTEGFYTGSLTREGQNENNDVGSYAITLGTLACSNNNFRLVLSIRKASYIIKQVPITIKVVDSALSKYYDEVDPIFACELKEGSLIYGDRIDFDGEFAPVRESKKSIDDVGLYPIDTTPIRIVNGENENVSANYYIQYVTQNFEIKVRNLFVTPKSYSGTYGEDFYTLFALDSEDKKYSVQFENAGGIKVDYTFRNGDQLYGQFGLEPIEGEAGVYKSYKITLGTITVRNSKGMDVSDNYTITQNTKEPRTYTLRKIGVTLEVVGSVTKVFGEKDPQIAVALFSGAKLPDGYTLASTSSAGRMEGEDAGEYEILTSNANGGIKILDSNGNDATNYFNISVIVGDKKFTISKYKLFVGVNSKTYLKGDNSIRSLVFKDETNKTVSKEIIDGSKLNSCFRITAELIEGDNVVTPQVVTGSEEKLKNFDYTCVEGVVTLVYPENTVYVNEIDSAEQIAVKNKHITYKAGLYQTLQMYSVKTGNGQSPTRTVEVTIKVPQELYNKEIYVLAAHPDGTVVKLDAISADGTITISDNEFNYIMLCTQETWPYYLIVGGVVLIIIGIIAIILRVMVRKKRRGGEAKRNFAKEGMEKPSKTPKKGGKKDVELSSGIAPTKVEHDFVDDEDLYASSITPAESDKKSKKKKVDKKTPASDSHTITLGGTRPSGGGLSGGTRPSGLSGATPGHSDDSLIDLDIPTSADSHTSTPSSSIDLSLADDDDIVISTTTRRDEEGASSDSGSVSTPSFGMDDDDDEIIITSSVRRGED